MKSLNNSYAYTKLVATRPSLHRTIGRKLRIFLTIGACALLPLALPGCGGDNLFENAVKRSESEKARAALESGDLNSAISTLEDYLKNHPEDSAARAMLANAYLKKTGVDLLKIGTSISSGGNGESDWSSVSNSLPSTSSENIANLESAVQALTGIPEAERTDEQNFQLAIAQTSLAVTVAKQYTTSSDGQSNTENIDQMSDSDALTIYNALQGTKSASDAMSTPNSGLSKVGSLADSVDQQSGSTPEEKLRNFLKSQG